MRLDAVHENRLLSRWAGLLPRSPQQLGRIHQADAELIPLGDGRLLALTVDTVAEEIELGIYRSPETAGRIAALASLSDLAAVGADPLGLLLAVTLPRGAAEPVQAEVARGVSAVCLEAGVFVLGGDTGEAERLAVTCVAAGTLPAPSARLRVGASPGEEVFASGPLGAGNALAAAAVLGARLPSCGEQAFRPCPRLREGRALRGIATAGIDTSDGLIASLDQLARLNGLALALEAPLEELLAPSAAELRQVLRLDAFPFLAGQHGEFELVFTVPPARLPALREAAAPLGWEPIRIGRTSAGAGLSIQGAPVDGARVRNLLADCDGDLRAYAAALCDPERRWSQP